MFGIFLAVVCLIVYGSLYPWSFEHRELPANPLWILLHAWGIVWDRRTLADVIINISLYVPLGMSGYLAFRRFRIAAPILTAVVVSGSVEMLQLFTPTRTCSAIDLVNNVAGAAAGAGFGVMFENFAGAVHPGMRRSKDQAALMLISCWVATLLFPFYPESHLLKLRAELAEFRHSAVFSLAPFLSAAAGWFVAGRLLAASGFRRPIVWLAISLVALPAQFLIITRQPAPVDFIGAAAGFVLCLAFGSRVHAPVLAACFVGLLLIRGLAPFHFAEPQAFIWVPFQGFLDMNWQTGIQVLLEKIFYYGSTIWLLRTSGMRFPPAIAIVAVLLALIEAVQTRLPGRTAEITEPILGFLIGAVLWALSRGRQSHSTTGR